MHVLMDPTERSDARCTPMRPITMARGLSLLSITLGRAAYANASASLRRART